MNQSSQREDHQEVSQIGPVPLLATWVVSVLLGVIILTGFLTVGASPASAELRKEAPTMPRDVSFYNEFDGSYYHVYAQEIDWEQPVGVVYYFSGDFFRKSESEFHHPRGATLRTLADEAAARNMLLVVPKSPADRGYEGYTWWEDGDDNAVWFRELHDQIIARYEPASEKIWFMGYSGGAEFIAQQILPEFQESFGTGGALMVGGGGPPADEVTVPRGVREILRLMWVVGEDDTAGSTNPPSWSALKAARSGEKFYRQRGFAHTTLQIAEDTDHLDYELDEVLDAHFDHFGVPRTNTNATVTAIGWSSLGLAITGGLGGLFAWRRKRKQREH